MTSKEDLETFYTPSLWTKRFNSEKVVEEYIKFINEKSKEVKNIPSELNIAYGQRPREKYNIMGTDLCPESPILIYIHGGYYVEESITHMNNIYIANAMYKNQIKTIAFTHELRPNRTVLEILEDIKVGLKSCISYGEKCKTSGIYIMGHSAGALSLSNLFTDLLNNLTENQQKLIKAIFLISGLYNLETFPNISMNDMVNLSEETAVSLSPLLTGVNYGKVKCFVIVAEHDSPWFIKQAKQFARKLKQDKYECELWIISNVDHFNIVENLYYEDFELTQKILNFIIQ